MRTLHMKARNTIYIVAVTMACSIGSVYAGILGSMQDLASGKHLLHREATFHEDFAPTAVAFSPDGAYVADGGMETDEVHIWDVKKKTRVQELKVFMTIGVFGKLISWSPDGRYLATCTLGPDSLIVWDTKTWKQAHAFSHEKWIGRCLSPVFTHDGQHLLLGHSGGIEIYNTTHWETEGNIDIPVNSHYSVADITLSSDDKKIAIAEDGYWNENIPESRVAIIDTKKIKAQHEWKAYSNGARSIIRIANSPDDGRLITSTYLNIEEGNDSVKIWDINTGKLLNMPFTNTPPKAAEGQISSIGFDITGTYIFCGERYTTARIHLFDATSYALLDQVHGDGAIMAMSNNPSAPGFAVASGSTISIWSINPKGD